MSLIHLSAYDLILVFGSNTRGIHGKGSALAARNYFGATLYRGRGRQGRSFAIPTKDDRIVTLPMRQITPGITEFIKYATQNPNLQFLVTRVGCGLAGLRDADVAPYFREAPLNCHLPTIWNDLLERNGDALQLVNDIGMPQTDFDILQTNFSQVSQKKAPKP